jgi:hypothetical protein
MLGRAESLRKVVMTSTMSVRNADPDLRPPNASSGGHDHHDGQHPPTDAMRRRQWRQLAGTARWDEPDHHDGRR